MLAVFLALKALAYMQSLIVGLGIYFGQRENESLCKAVRGGNGVSFRIDNMTAKADTGKMSTSHSRKRNQLT